MHLFTGFFASVRTQPDTGEEQTSFDALCTRQDAARPAHCCGGHRHFREGSADSS